MSMNQRWMNIRKENTSEIDEYFQHIRNRSTCIIYNLLLKAEDAFLELVQLENGSTPQLTQVASTAIQELTQQSTTNMITNNEFCKNNQRKQFMQVILTALIQNHVNKTYCNSRIYPYK